jgi:hypothetical protein
MVGYLVIALIFGVGFALGYSVRAGISAKRRRRAKLAAAFNPFSEVRDQ